MATAVQPLKLEIPLRTLGPAGHGTKGREINLYANFFPVTIGNNNITIVHYDVTIRNHAQSEKIPRRIKREVFKEWKKCFPQDFKGKGRDPPFELAYDGEKNAYSINTIDKFVKKAHYEVKLVENADGTPRQGATAPLQTMQSIAAALPPAATKAGEGGKNKKKKDRRRREKKDDPGESDGAAKKDRNVFTVDVKKVDFVNLSELLDSLKPNNKNRVPISTHIMNILEVMFRHYRAEQFSLIGRNSYFSMKGEFGNPWEVGAGKEGSTGLFASLRPTAWKNGSILLNLDKSHCAFYKPQPVIEFLQEVFSRDRINFQVPLDRRIKTSAQKEIKGLKVRVEHSTVKRSYRVNGITNDGANKLTFNLDKDGKSETVTVSNYFFKTYGVRLNYPQFNCLHVGNPTKSIYIPTELCSIERGQRVNKKLSDTETAKFIRNTAVKPADRLREIKHMVSKCNFRNDPILNALTFTISDQPLKLIGRVLPDPTLVMQRNARSTNLIPQEGIWDVRNYQFHQTKPLNSWVILNFDRYAVQDIDPFLNALYNHGRNLGMTINRVRAVINVNRRIPNHFEDIKSRFPDVQLIMCILDSRHHYATIKKIGDRDFKIITQCLMARTMSGKQGRPDTATINNILMKINGKMGGVNNITVPNAELNFEKVIVMGADVNHPPAGGSTAMPSIAAVVGSIDGCATKYAVEVRAQTHRVEIIQDMASMAKSLLLNFRESTLTPPGKIVMYRDGVSESQFAEVLSSELTQIRKACNELSPSYKPSITFICVQKRHHTRLFVQDHKDGAGRGKNVPPGTIVDREITHPTENDFYLCSHVGVQGTSRPAHYHVLWDDSNMSADMLQRMTYELCHVYSRCSRAVSIPTPAYYAHWAAFRSKTYASLIIDDTTSVSSGESHHEPNDAVMRLTKVSRYDTQLAQRMYYI